MNLVEILFHVLVLEFMEDMGLCLNVMIYSEESWNVIAFTVDMVLLWETIQKYLGPPTNVSWEGLAKAIF